MRRPALILLSIVIFAACSTSNHYSALTKQQAEAMVRENITQKELVIDVNRALPTQGRSVNLTGAYNLRIKGDSVYSYLPYYGRAYSVPYGGGEGLIFDGLTENYTVSTGSRNETSITFNVSTREDRYTFNLDIWPNGSTNINVNSNNRQQITYMGTMRPGPAK